MIGGLKIESHVSDSTKGLTVLFWWPKNVGSKNGLSVGANCHTCTLLPCGLKNVKRETAVEGGGCLVYLSIENFMTLRIKWRMWMDRTSFRR